jgi:hypothetical protein
VQEVKGSPGAVVIKLEGTGHTLQIGKDVFRLAQNADILEAVEGTLAPIKEHKQARAIEFSQDDKPVSSYQEKDVEAIIASCEDPGGAEPAELDEREPKTVTAVLYAHGPVFDVKAPNWRFMYKRKPIYLTLKKRILPRTQSSVAGRL